MDIAGIRNTDGVALIEIDYFSGQVAWLHESIAADRDIKEMMQWLSDYYSNQKLTKEENESLLKRAASHPKLVEPDFLFKLTTLSHFLWHLLDYRLKNNIEE